MANTPPRPEIHERASDELVEDLCIELRYVACGDADLPGGEWVLDHIEDVVAIHHELRTRDVDFKERLEVLSDETKWQIVPLLDDSRWRALQRPALRSVRKMH